MYSNKIWTVLFIAFSSTVFTVECTKIARAKIETCSGCSLYSLPSLKQFIFEDYQTYKNTELKFIVGAMPVLFLYNELDEEVERIPLEKYLRKDCNELLVKHGFEKKQQEEPEKEEL